MRYTFTKSITFLQDFDAYLMSSFDKYDGATTNNTDVYIDTTMDLTGGELTTLGTLVDDYTNPDSILELYSTISSNIYSNFTKTPGIVDKFDSILLTHQPDTDLTIDNIKTVFEYNCPNVSLYSSSSIGNINFNIQDTTSDVSVLSENISVNDITSQWNTLAQTGSTIASTLFKIVSFSDLNYSAHNTDSTWDITGNVPSTQPFDYRVNGLIYSYYSTRTI